jgi:hypothetical protein
MADNLPPTSAGVMESRSLNLPEPSMLHRPVMGLLYLLHIVLDQLTLQYHVEGVLFLMFADSYEWAYSICGVPQNYFGTT